MRFLRGIQRRKRFRSLGEFRDLGWTLDYYSGAHPLLHGSTLGGLVVPLLPSPIWSVVGVDKAAVFAHSNAAVLAQEIDPPPDVDALEWMLLTTVEVNHKQAAFQRLPRASATT